MMSEQGSEAAKRGPFNPFQEARTTTDWLLAAKDQIALKATIGGVLLVVVVAVMTGDVARTLTVSGFVAVPLAGIWTSKGVRRASNRRRLRSLRHAPGTPARVGIVSLAPLGASESELRDANLFAWEVKSKIGEVEGIVPANHRVGAESDRAAVLRETALSWNVHYVVACDYQRNGAECQAWTDIVQAWDQSSARSGRVQTSREPRKLAGRIAEEAAEHLKRTVLGRQGTEPALTAAEQEGLRRANTTSDAARDEFAAAKWHSDRYNNRRDVADFRLAEKHLNTALAQDPDYLDARAELGFLYLLRWETDRDGEWKTRSRRAFENVVAREPNHPMAVAQLGYYACVDGHINDALALVERAAGLYPGHMVAENVRALVHLYVGFYESAVQLTEHSVLPVAPTYVYPRTNAATAALLMGDPDAALEWTKRGQQIDRDAFVVALFEGTAHFHKGDLKAAEAAWRRGRARSPQDLRSLFDVVLAWLSAARDDQAAALRILEEHRNAGWVGSVYDPFLVSLAALAGAHDEAMALLEQERTWGASYRYLVSDPTLRPLHDHEAFRRLLETRYQTWLQVADRAQQAVPAPPPLPTPQEAVAALATGDAWPHSPRKSKSR